MSRIEPIKIKRAVWDGQRWRAKDPAVVNGERIGEHFAVHKVIEVEVDYQYTVTHIKTGWALCRTQSKLDARRAVGIALGWPGIDWTKLTARNQQEPSVMSRGLALLRSLAESGLAADLHIEDDKVRRRL
jgi:hypothetical protein